MSSCAVLRSAQRRGSDRADAVRALSERALRAVLATDREKVTIFNRTYDAVSKPVRNRKVDSNAKARLKART